MIHNITPVIIAKDAQDTIEETLKSLVSFEEVIVYLNNSTVFNGTLSLVSLWHKRG